MPVINDQVGLILDRVVLATDFTSASEVAVAYAKRLAKRFASTVTLTNVVDLSGATRSESAIMGMPMAKLLHHSAENLEQLLGEMTMEEIRATAQTLESHSPAAAVIGLSTDLKADLIITGTHARRGLDKAIMGSFSEGVIRHAACPVLTIGPKVPMPEPGPGTFHTIVFATHFGPESADKAVTAFALAQDSGAAIYLCHVLKDAGEDISDTLALHLRFEAQLGDLIPGSAYDWCNPECVVEHGKAAPHILALAKRVGADLIVLGATPSLTWYAHLVEGTVGQVIAGSECPVMTIGSK